jgi:hypothetical protein
MASTLPLTYRQPAAALAAAAHPCPAVTPTGQAVTTGSYTGAGGEFSFTFPFPGVLDMTHTLLGADQQ